jgi:hypothetical protein
LTGWFKLLSSRDDQPLRFGYSRENGFSSSCSHPEHMDPISNNILDSLIKLRAMQGGLNGPKWEILLEDSYRFTCAG